jgi:hypothetical protein
MATKALTPQARAEFRARAHATPGPKRSLPAGSIWAICPRQRPDRASSPTQPAAERSAKRHLPRTESQPGATAAHAARPILDRQRTNREKPRRNSNHHGHRRIEAGGRSFGGAPLASSSACARC